MKYTHSNKNKNSSFIPKKEPTNININDNPKIVKITANKIGINGEAIALNDKKILFVPYLLDSEEANVKVVDIKDKYAIGEIDSIIAESRLRITPKCPYYYECGVCTLGHTIIDNELRIKRDILLESLKKYYQTIDEKIVSNMIPSLNEFGYRNKVTLPIRFINNKNQFGLLKPRSNHFKAIDHCIIQDETINEILGTITKLLDKHHISGLSVKEKEGVISLVIVRTLYYSRQTSITFVLTKNTDLSKVVDELVLQHKNILSVSKVINSKTDSKQIYNETEELIFGSKYITEAFDNFQFKLAPSSFFQLNTPVASSIYNKISEIVRDLHIKIAVDAYSGIGIIGMYISKYVDKVYSIDVEKANFESAKKNILANGIKNIKLINKDFFMGFKEIINDKIDLICFDPARTGLGQNVCELLIKSQIKHVIYLSCNPATLAKDLVMIKDNYELKYVIPYNMFPRTPHIESLCYLVRK